MLTGKAFSRAVRGHLLCSSALQSIILEEFWSELSAADKLVLQRFYASEEPATFRDEELAVRLTTWMENKFTKLEQNRTAALWIRYIKYVSVMQEFIRAERLDDFELHILATKAMLNLFAATGHNNYAKSCRLYLQSVDELERNRPEVFEEFQKGNHTVRRTQRNWTGIWTDLSIEQILMKSLKGRSGVIGKGITENFMLVWMKTMHRCAEVTETLDSMMPKDSKVAPQHKEASTGRIKRDHEDYEKIQVRTINIIRTLPSLILECIAIGKEIFLINRVKGDLIIYCDILKNL